MDDGVVQVQLGGVDGCLIATQRGLHLEAPGDGAVQVLLGGGLFFHQRLQAGDIAPVFLQRGFVLGELGFGGFHGRLIIGLLDLKEHVATAYLRSLA